MTMVLDRISSSTETQTDAEDFVSADGIERIIGEQNNANLDTIDKEISASLSALENQLRQRDHA